MDYHLITKLKIKIINLKLLKFQYHMKTGINVALIFLLSFFVLSCNENNKEGANTSSNGLYENSDQNGEKTTTAEQPKLQGTTSIEWTETDYNFGTVDEGAIVNHSFKFKNTGNVPLVISDSRADCGCTVPNRPTEAILPGKEGQIDVKFNSSGKGGQDVNKTVTVIANTEPSDSKLHILGKVRGKNEGAPFKK
jgi:hypothetical protein